VFNILLQRGGKGREEIYGILHRLHIEEISHSLKGFDCWKKYKEINENLG